MVCLCSLMSRLSMGRCKHQKWLKQLENGVICSLLHSHIRHVGRGDSSWAQLTLQTTAPTHGLSMWLAFPYSVVQKGRILEESIKKLSFLEEPDRSSMASCDLDPKVTPHPFHHILLCRSETGRLTRFKKRVFRPHFLLREWHYHTTKKASGMGGIIAPILAKKNTYFYVYTFEVTIS